MVTPAKIFFSSVDLSFEEWIACVIIGSFSIFNAWVVRLVPAEWFGAAGSSEMKPEEREANAIAPFLRRNSKQNS